MSEYNNGLFIFRRDFRVIDNIGLNLANSKCNRIFAIFIFTPEQVGNTNQYKSDNAVQFMIESLQDLSVNIRKMGGELLCFYGHNEKIIKDLIDDLHIDYICFNADYTPYAIQRDIGIIEVCNNKNIYVDYTHDYYLHPPGTFVTSSGDPYQKFTPFYNMCLKKKVELPQRLRKINFSKTTKHLTNKISLKEALNKFTKENNNILVHGGRDNAIKQLRIAGKNINNYQKTRNNLNHSTSELSAYIKFGCVSIREVYKIFRNKKDFIRQLFWRDFYANILYSFPHVLGHNLKEKYDKIRWHNSSRLLSLWTKGETGFPVVDACMRQLNTTGYMHNRGRLIVGSFLVKTLLINWRHGEKYFATKLTDYDVASNNGNWEWISGGGADSMPYFRFFNPWSQQQEHDPDCEYIKKWIPELKEVPSKDIHNWEKEYENYKNINYPKPIVDYVEQRQKAIKMYKEGLY